MYTYMCVYIYIYIHTVGAKLGRRKRRSRIGAAGQGLRKQVTLKLFALLAFCVSSVRRAHANILRIFPSLTDDAPKGILEKQATMIAVVVIIIGKRDSSHHHLQEVISETTTVPLLRRKLLYTTPSGWWWWWWWWYRCIPMHASHM